MSLLETFFRRKNNRLNFLQSQVGEKTKSHFAFKQNGFLIYDINKIIRYQSNYQFA